MSVGTSEARPRQRKLVNPEHLDHALRRILNAWLRPDVDLRREPELREAIESAHALLGLEKRSTAAVLSVPLRR